MQGSWLRVPLGKLNTERTVPLDETTLATLVGWLAERGPQRALPHPRHGRLTDFVFVRAGRRPGARPLQAGLTQAVQAAGLTGTDGEPMHVVTHQLGHTYATSLARRVGCRVTCSTSTGGTASWSREVMIHRGEHLFGDHAPVVPGPAPDDRVEPPDHRLGVGS